MLLSLIGCSNSPKALGSKALKELSKSELELSPSVIAVDNVSVDVQDCILVKTDSDEKRYSVNGIIHNVGRSVEDSSSGAIARGDRISIDIHVNSDFTVGSTGAIKITYFDKRFSVKKI
jgi:hypothetical protein